MRIVSGFHVREVLDEVVAVPTGEAAQRLFGIVSLNEVSKFLFEKLNSEQTEETLVTALLEEFEVDQGTAETDVKEFLTYLREFNLIVE